MRKKIRADYWVHDDGTVTEGGRVITPFVSQSDDCYMVSMRDSKGRQVKRHVHRLVALAFVPKPRNAECAVFINGDRYDCRASNVTWITLSEKQRRIAARKTLRFKPTPLEHISASMKWG